MAMNEDETHYESRESMPWNQFADLDFDAARAAWERQGEQSAAWADYCQDMAEMAAGDAEAALLAGDERAQEGK